MCNLLKHFQIVAQFEAIIARLTQLIFGFRFVKYRDTIWVNQDTVFFISWRWYSARK